MKLNRFYSVVGPEFWFGGLNPAEGFFKYNLETRRATLDITFAHTDLRLSDPVRHSTTFVTLY